MTGPADPVNELAKPEWTRLLAAARRKLERSGGIIAGAVSLSKVSDAERRLIIGLTGRYRSSSVSTIRIPLATLDDAVHDVCGVGLVRALALVNGPVRNRPAERADEQSAKEAAVTDARRRCVIHRDEPWFGEWLEGLCSDGTVTRLVRRGEAEMLGWAAEVLRRLPATSLPLPALAEQATGNTKALSGTPLAGIVLRALALRSGVPAPASRAGQRARWEAAGVLVDDMASQVLVLGVRCREDTVVAGWLADAADFGIPFRLTLHQLTLDPLTPIANDLYVCENPAVLRVAAAELEGKSAPLICTEGQPSVACERLLRAATGRIHWRGDFDWTGLRTTGRAIEQYAAAPWRMSSADYLAALNAPPAATEPLTEALKGPPAPSPWDPALAGHLTASGRAVMEERLIPDLIDDLRDAHDQARA